MKKPTPEELKAPIKIWANIYNLEKPSSWDLFFNEDAAVTRSIGAPTHCYIHEMSVNAYIKENEDLKKKLRNILQKNPQYGHFLAHAPIHVPDWFEYKSKNEPEEPKLWSDYPDSYPVDELEVLHDSIESWAENSFEDEDKPEVREGLKFYFDAWTEYWKKKQKFDETSDEELHYAFVEYNARKLLEISQKED